MAPNPFDDEVPETSPETAAKAPATSTEGQHTGDNPAAVNVTLKAGKGYEAPWITIQGASVLGTLSLFKGWTLDETRARFPVVSEALAALIKEVNGAGAAFQNDYENRGKVAAKGTYGKPANADANVGSKPTTVPAEDVPFGNDGTPNTPEPMLACEHGTRKLVVWKGKSYHVCPLGKGAEGYCGAVEA